MKTLAFDVYGTMIDTAGVSGKVKAMIGEIKADLFVQTWRDKQLEYSFRRGLMDLHVDFSVVTEQALTYTCQYLNVELSPDSRRELMEVYKTLPPFEDVKDTLAMIAANADIRIFAFSNGSHQAVEGLLNHANLRSYFDGVVSCATVKMFKPNPVVYNYFLEQTQAVSDQTYLISGNPFDVLGAMNVGFQGVWVNRKTSTVFDPWGKEPTHIIRTLTELPAQLFH